MKIDKEEKYPKIIVGILIYNDEGKLFLARSHKWKDKWIIPWWHLEFWETLEECVCREVKEETNLEIENIQFVEIQESIFPEDFHIKKHMVFFDFIGKVKEIQEIVLNDELEDFWWFSFDELEKLDTPETVKEFIESVKKKKLICL